MREVRDSDLGPETEYGDRVFVIFLNPPGK
jgi:hypothetical protein